MFFSGANSGANSGFALCLKCCGADVEREAVWVRDSGVNNRQVYVCLLLLTRPCTGGWSLRRAGKGLQERLEYEIEEGSLGRHLRWEKEAACLLPACLLFSNSTIRSSASANGQKTSVQIIYHTIRFRHEECPYF